MIVTTEAIVLRARKQGETSKIATLYTLGFGKLNVIAKGAREMKSKFGGALEMFARSSAMFYKREKEDALHLLSKAETIDSHSGILKSLVKMEAATGIIELLLHAMHDEEANAELFELLAGTLYSIAESDEEAAPLLRLRFYLAFAKLMGFEIDLAGSEKYSTELRGTLEALEGWTGGPDPLGSRGEQQLSSFFAAYFAEHLPGVSLRSLRSAKVFSAL